MADVACRGLWCVCGTTKKNVGMGIHKSIVWLLFWDSTLRLIV